VVKSAGSSVRKAKLLGCVKESRNLDGLVWSAGVEKSYPMALGEAVEGANYGLRNLKEDFTTSVESKNNLPNTGNKNNESEKGVWLG